MRDIRDMGRDFLAATLAIELNLAGPDDLARAMARLSSDTSLGLIGALAEAGALADDSRALLEKLVDEKLAENDDVPGKSLVSFGGIERETEEGALPGTGEAGGVGIQGADDGGGTVIFSDGEREAVEAGEGFAGSTLVESGDGGAGAAAPGDTERLTTEHPGRYTIKAEHGRGGMGVVLLAVDEHVGREVAIKELLPFSTGSASGSPSRATIRAAARFLREARITGRLEHPGIVPVYEIARRRDGSIYYTMKFVRGETLAAKLGKAGNVSDRLALLNHFLDLCQAVAYAHSRGVIHRDLKPANVMVGEFGETVVLDWGLAKMKGADDDRADSIVEQAERLRNMDAGETAAGTPMGTPSYMSPEQAEGRVGEIDERSDVWSLGVILYELLSGRTPFSGGNAYEVMGKVISAPVPPLGPETKAPPELRAIAMKCLEKDPAERYGDASELAADLARFLSGGLVSAYDYNLGALLARFVSRHKYAIAVAALVVLAAGAGLYGWLSVKKQARVALENELMYVAAEAQLIDVDQAKRGMKKFDQFLSRHPDFSRGYFERAQFKLKHGLEADAVADFNRAIAIDPEYVHAYHYRGNAHAAMGETDRAIEDYNRAIALDPNFSYPFNNRGNMYRRKGDDGRALEDFNHAIELDPDGVYAFNNRALVWRDRGELDKAVADFSKAVELDPEFALGYINRARVRLGQDDWEGAMNDFSRALEADPKNTFALRMRAEAKLKQGDRKGALDDLDHALLIDPGYRYGLRARGDFHMEDGNYEKALADYERALDADPEYAAALAGKTRALIALGQWGPAEAAAARLIELEPDNVEAFELRARALAELGEKGKAADVLEGGAEAAERKLSEISDDDSSRAELEKKTAEFRERAKELRDGADQSEGP